MKRNLIIKLDIAHRGWWGDSEKTGQGRRISGWEAWVREVGHRLIYNKQITV